jgi:demethylmenaquinone methyltransferase/2-methoxy-6-polyprenyl-1,4-benzoquinol methylase
MLKKPDQKHKSWRPLQKMFTEVSARYDLMNRLLTLRFDEHWRRLAARECISGNPSKILDLCTGTGDLALHISGLVNGTAKVIGLDYSEPMLEPAKNKARKASAKRICFMKGGVAGITTAYK